MTPKRTKRRDETGRVLPFQGPRRRSPGAARGILGTVSPFKRASAPLKLMRRGERIRRLRRHPLLRLARPLAVALLIVGSPVALVVWVGHSPLFALDEVVIDVDPGGRVTPAWVHRALVPYVGRNLPRLPLSYVDRRLRRHPWVESAEVRKLLPGRLGVVVHEKRAVALLRRDEGFFYLDGAGGVIDRFDPANEVADLLLVTATVPLGGSRGEIASREVAPRRALLMAREIAVVGPAWAEGLSEIEILGENDFRVWSAGLPFPLLLRSGTLAERASYLEALLPQVARRYASVDAVDLRFARRIIVQPSPGGPGGATSRGVQPRGIDG